MDSARTRPFQGFTDEQLRTFLAGDLEPDKRARMEAALRDRAARRSLREQAAEERAEARNMARMAGDLS